MALPSYRRHRFPPEIIQNAIWLYLRFTLSYRDVEELLAERGLDISYETVRRWVLKFGPAIARRLRQRRPRPNDRWHLDEMVVRIAGERMYLWQAVDHEGEVLDLLVQRRRDSRAALRLMRDRIALRAVRPARPIVSVCTCPVPNQVLSSGDYGRGFLVKYFSCASRIACVRSGSRLLSGNTRTTGGFASASAPGFGSSGGVLSRQCARVFSQKMIAAMLPASATPRSSSSRKRVRSVFGLQSMILAMSS